MVNNNWLCWLIHLDLKELRRRQDITSQQIEKAYLSKRNMDNQLYSMNDMLDTLTEAILMKTEGEYEK